MLCIRPFRTGSGEFGCGQCTPCRVNVRRQWTGRILLEANCFADNVFVTLTYRDDPGELVPEDMTNFLKRFRYYLQRKVRYFGVGEYGDLRGRPHFHMALFGVSPLEEGIIAKAWSIGFVHVGDLTKDSAQYLCGYVTKKMTKAEDERLDGRYPEFARMSKDPGIGASALPVLREALAPDGDVTLMHRNGDVPSTMRTRGKELPLGRYLRGKLRESLGWDALQPQPVKVAQALAYQSLTTDQRTRLEKRRVNQYNSARARLKIHRGKGNL